MDFSKLPKLSESPVPPTPAQPVSTQPMDYRSPAAERPGAMGIEYTLVIAGVGLLMLLFVSGPQNLWQHFLTASPIPPVTDVDGITQITYPQSAFFKADLGVTVFFLVLIIEGLLSGLTRSALARVVIVIFAAASALLNIYVSMATKALIGLQLFNALAVIVSAVLAIYAVRWLAANKVATTLDAPASIR